MERYIKLVWWWKVRIALFEEMESCVGGCVLSTSSYLFFPKSFNLKHLKNIKSIPHHIFISYFHFSFQLKPKQSKHQRQKSYNRWPKGMVELKRKLKKILKFYILKLSESGDIP